MQTTLRQISENIQQFAINANNRTDHPQKVILFGSNQYQSASNYGSDTGIVISAEVNAPYYAKLLKTANEPLSVKKVKIVTLQKEQFLNEINLHVYDANGHLSISKINIDVEKIRQTVIGFIYEIDGTGLIGIDGNTHFEFILLPQNHISFVIDFNLVEKNHEQVPFFEKTEILIENKTEKSETVSLFNGYINCNLANYGNSNGVAINMQKNNVTYSYLINASMHYGIKIKNILLENITTNKIPFNYDIKVVHNPCTGYVSILPICKKRNDDSDASFFDIEDEAEREKAMQQHIDKIIVKPEHEIDLKEDTDPCFFELTGAHGFFDGNRGFQFNIPANTTYRVTFNPNL